MPRSQLPQTMPSKTDQNHTQNVPTIRGYQKRWEKDISEEELVNKLGSETKARTEE